MIGEWWAGTPSSVESLSKGLLDHLTPSSKAIEISGKDGDASGSAESHGIGEPQNFCWGRGLLLLERLTMSLPQVWTPGMALVRRGQPAVEVRSEKICLENGKEQNLDFDGQRGCGTAGEALSFLTALSPRFWRSRF